MDIKKIGIIVGAVLVVLIAVVLFIMLNGKKTPTSDNTPTNTTNVNNVDITQMAEELHSTEPSKAVEEIEEVLNTEVTDAQKDIFNEVMSDIEIPDNVVTDENGDTYYIDGYGDKVTVATL